MPSARCRIADPHSALVECGFDERRSSMNAR
jgi:hypothetical protein